MFEQESVLRRCCASAIWLLPIAGAAVALAGCEPPVPATRCDDNHPCPPGYACAPVRHFCVPVDSGPDGSAADAARDAANRDAANRDVASSDAASGDAATSDAAAPRDATGRDQFTGDGAVRDRTSAESGPGDSGRRDSATPDSNRGDTWSTWTGLAGSEFGPAATVVDWGSAAGGGVSRNVGMSWQVDVAIDGAGRPVVAWCDSTGGGTSQLYVRRFDGVVWSEVGPGSATGNGLSNADDYCYAPAVAANSAGHLAVAWAGGPVGAYAIYVLRFDGAAWGEVGAGSATGGGISQTADSALSPAIALDVAGQPVVAWSSGVLGYHEIYLRRRDGAAWVEVGAGSASGGGISQTAGNSTQPVLALDSSGQPTVAWIESVAGNSEIYVKRYTNDAWIELGGSAGGGGISATAARSTNPALVLDPTSAPIVAWQEYAPGNDDIYVKRYDGATWVAAGAGAAAGGGVSQSSALSLNPALTIDGNGRPLLVWQEPVASADEILGKRFDGQTWVEVGAGSASNGGISRNAGDSQWPALAFDARTGPVAAWSDNTSGNFEIYVRRFDGTAWVPFGAATATATSISQSPDPSTKPVLALLQDRPVVAWLDGRLGAANIFVRHQVSTTWDELPAGSASNGGITTGRPGAASVAIAAGPDSTLVAVWEGLNAGSGEIYALRFNGTVWAELGAGSASGGGISQSAGASREPAVAIDSAGLPIVAWQEDATNSNEIYVKRFDGTAWVELGIDSAARAGISDNRGNNSVQPAIAIDGTGQPIVAWLDDTSTSWCVYLRRFDGSAWSELGAGSASGAGISGATDPFTAPVIAVGAAGEPIVAWSAGTQVNTEVYVRRYDGAAWVAVGAGSDTGGGVSQSPGRSDEPALALDAARRPILAWQDDSSGNAEIYLRRYDGAAWVELGGRSAQFGGISNSSAGSLTPSIACSGNSVCVAWSEANQTSTEIVLRCAPLP